MDDLALTMEVGLPYGLRKGKLIHISELSDSEKGLRCNCICPHCNDQLIARLGKVRVRHFAHSKSDCGYGIESALHLKAKQILEQERKLVIPNYDYNDQTIIKSQEIFFDEIFLEKRISDIVPDLILKKGTKQLLVEIAVTHFVDEEKLNKIKSLNLSVIEIQIPIDVFDKNQFDGTLLTNLIVYETDYKKWINNIAANKMIEDLKRIEEENEKRRIEKLNREREKQRELMEADEKLRQKKLQSIRLLLDPLMQAKERAVWETELPKSRDWQKILSYLQINATNIPNYLNLKIKDDFVFQCDRRLWQSAIFSAFIYLKKLTGPSKLIRVTDIQEWIYGRNYLPLKKDLIDLSDYPELKEVNGLKGVITAYLHNLARYGFLRPITTEWPMIQPFKRLENKMKLLNSTYKSSLFIEHEELLINSETGEIVGELKDLYIPQ